jgi:hypothetical protein
VGLDQQNGTMGAAGGATVLAKGFNPTNPHRGSTVIATFLWTGPAGNIASVTDRLANGAPVGNVYQLVESVSNGTMSMATYVATNVQGFPDPCCSTAGSGQDSVYVVQAVLNQGVAEAGVIISSYTGVEPSFAAALGPHVSNSGSGTTTTSVTSGPMAADSGSLVYGVAIASPVSGHSGPGAPFQLVGSGSSPSIEADARWAEAPSTGSINPTWTWFFAGPGTWLASGLVLRAAGGGPPPTTGNLSVTTSTSGSSLDADGYSVAVDGGTGQAIGINSSFTFTGLSAGNHSVALSGAASNCTVSGSNPRTISVPAGGTASTTFSVTCTTTPTTGDLSVTTSTSGSSLDPDGFSVAVDGGAGQAIGINGSFTFTNLSAGNHSVALSGVASNCTVSGANPRTISVPSGGTASTTFSVSCSTSPGNLAVTTSTSGSSLDPDGYSVAVDGGAGQAIGINGSLTFTNLSAGTHSVALSGVASNCAVSSNPRTVSVPSGGTASTTFSVTCTTPPGNLTVNTSTSGSSLDPDGYTVMLDGGNARAIGINSSTTYTNLTPGNHSVSISGVAGNCTLSGSNPRTISVPSGGTANTTFSVSCVTPNTAPVVNAGPDQTALTGLLFSENWSFTDPNNGPWNYTIDWGDGTATSGSKSAPGSFSNGHTYITILPRNFTIRITVTDSMGASHTDTKVVTVLLL